MKNFCLLAMSGYSLRKICCMVLMYEPDAPQMLASSATKDSTLSNSFLSTQSFSCARCILYLCSSRQLVSQKSLKSSCHYLNSAGVDSSDSVVLGIMLSKIL